MGEQDKDKITQEREKSKREVKNPLTDYREYLESLSEEQRKYLESLSEEELALQLELHRKLLEKRKALRDPEKRKELERERWKARYGTQKQKENRTQDPQKENKNSQPERTHKPIEPEPEPEPKPANSITRKKTANRYFLRLATKRKLHVNPLRLSEEAKNHILYHSQKGTTAPAYVFLVINSDGKPTDAGLVRTYPTLKKIDTKLRDEGKRILLHPQDIRIPEGFWQKWKTARTPQDRLRLIKEYELLTDKAVRTIDKIVLDVDTPYEKAFPKVLRIFQSLGIDRGYEIGRTKSGNLRAVIYLTHTIKAQKDFRKNKHIERLREAYYLLVELFRRHELKLDRTFADRINHPVWFSFDNRFYRRESKVEGTVDFYGLYRNIKKWQSQNQVWEVENINLTQKFWGDRRANKGKKKVPIQLPAFIRNELRTTFDEDYKLALWKKAVKSLYKGKGYRFQRFILPAIGWAKHLGLDRLEVDRYLESFLSDRDPQKTEKDLRTAWRTARELEFNLPEQKGLPTTDLVEITEKALEFVRDRGQVERQELIAEVFGGQKWLCDMVMEFLEKKGFVKSEVLKDGRIGRPPKVYRPLPVELDYDKGHEIEEESLANILTPPLAEYPLGVGGPKGSAPKTFETISSFSSSQTHFSSPQTQNEKVDTGTQKVDTETQKELTERNGHAHTDEIRLVFLRELRDEELVKVRELVGAYETPEGLPLVIEVSGQRMETGLRVSLAIAQQKELRGLGVEVVPPAEVVPEETHEAVPPVEEVPLSAPTVPVPETEPEEVPEETHEEVPPHIAKAKAMIRVAFSEYGRLGLAWSGGKDSTTLLALAIEVLRENTGDWSLVIVHNDTLVENPIVREHCDKSIEELRDYIVRENLPIEIRIARPSTKETFWVNLVGKGYPLPYHNLRWCQRALKIKPFSKVARDLKVVLVGVREKESNARKGLINKNYKNGKSERFKQVHIAPIVDWSDEDVWEFLTTYECEWTDLRRVYDLYKSASGECPVFSQQKTVCGARFGCWVCPMVKEDKSLRNMLEEYPHLKPLYELRQWLIDFCNRPENRTGKRRNGKPLGEGKGQLTLQARQEIFKRLMDMGLLTQEEISKIKEEWKREYPEETYEEVPPRPVVPEPEAEVVPEETHGEVPEPEADTIGDTSGPTEPSHEETPPAGEEIPDEEIPEELLREFLEEEGQQQKKGIGIKGVIRGLERLVRGYARVMEHLEGMERAIEKLPDAKVKKKALRRLDEFTEALRVLEFTLEMVKLTLGQKTRIGKGVIKELERLVRGYARVMERLERIEMKRAIEKLPIEKLPDAKVKEEALRHLDEIREMLTEGIRGVEHILEMAKATLERRKKVSNPMSVRVGYRAFQIWLNVYRELTLQDLPDKKKKSGLEKFIKLVDEYLRQGHDPEEFMEILKKVMKVQFARFINGKADLESLESLTPSDLVYNFSRYLPIALYDRVMAEHIRRTQEYARELLGEDYERVKELFWDNGEPTHEVPEKEVPPAVYEASVVHSQSQSKRTPANGNGVVHAVPLPANGRKSSGSPDPYNKARELMAGLCERVRNFGLAVYEVHYQDRLAVYWERGQSSIKVYEVRYKQKDLREIEHELRHMLGLVLRADRLIAEGYSEDLVFSLILQARDNQGRFSFVDRNGRLEVYMGKKLVKVYEKQ